MGFDNTRYQCEYIRENFKRIDLKIHKEKEADLIEWLNLQENRQGYIKSLIRQDMEKHKANGT